MVGNEAAEGGMRLARPRRSLVKDHCSDSTAKQREGARPRSRGIKRPSLKQNRPRRNCRAQQPYFFSARSFRMTASGFGAGAPTSFKVFVS